MPCTDPSERHPLQRLLSVRSTLKRRKLAAERPFARCREARHSRQFRKCAAGSTQRLSAPDLLQNDTRTFLRRQAAGRTPESGSVCAFHAEPFSEGRPGPPDAERTAANENCAAHPSRRILGGFGGIRCRRPRDPAKGRLTPRRHVRERYSGSSPARNLPRSRIGDPAFRFSIISTRTGRGDIFGSERSSMYLTFSLL